MKKTVSSLFAIFFFLTQALPMASGLSAQSDGLNPPSSVDNIPFKQLYTTLCLAVTIYKLDAIEGISKNVIIKEYGKDLSGPLVKFDLEKIGTSRKGWTRYYPVMIKDRQCVARIFLTSEKTFQPRMTVLYEMVLGDPAVTCQLLPSINSIIESRKAQPLTTFLDLSASQSI